MSSIEWEGPGTLYNDRGDVINYAIVALYPDASKCVFYYVDESDMNMKVLFYNIVLRKPSGFHAKNNNLYHTLTIRWNPVHHDVGDSTLYESALCIPPPLGKPIYWYMQTRSGKKQELISLFDFYLVL